MLTNFAVLNLGFISIFVFAALHDIKQFKSYLEIKDYVQKRSISIHNIAPSKMQDDFDTIISECGLTINNKNVVYSAFEEKNDVIMGTYELAAKGQYLLFIKYLETLQKQNMLYKINLLSLKVKSLEEININLNIESLYEIK